MLAPKPSKYFQPVSVRFLNVLCNSQRRVVFVHKQHMAALNDMQGLFYARSHRSGYIFLLLNFALGPTLY